MRIPILVIRLLLLAPLFRSIRLQISFPFQFGFGGAFVLRVCYAVR